MRAIILAAGVGKRLQEQGKVMPKCFVKVGGKRLVDLHLERLAECGVQDACFVVGYMAAEIRAYLAENTSGVAVSFIENSDYLKGNILSAYAAHTYFDEPFVLMDADVAYPAALFGRLLNSPHADCLLLDENFNNDAEEMKLGADENGRVWEICRRLSKNWAAQGEGVGFFKCSAATGALFREMLGRTIAAGGEALEYEEGLNMVMKLATINFEYVAGLPWTEIDFPEDLEKANAIFANRT
jgi:choline kinase